MKTEIDYSQMNDAEKFWKAVNDCKEYFGDKKFEEIVKAAKEDKPTLDHWAKMLGFLAGIEGYPVKAMYQYMFGFDSIKEDSNVT
jgi:hypothetical protein